MTEALYGITHSGLHGGFRLFEVRRCPHDGKWRVGGCASEPEIDVASKAGGGLYPTPKEAWRGWKRYIARLAVDAKRRHKEHVSLLKRYREADRD